MTVAALAYEDLENVGAGQLCLFIEPPKSWQVAGFKSLNSDRYLRCLVNSSRRL